MPSIGRDPNKTRAELAAGESGGQAVQRAQETGLQLGEGVQQRQAQAFHAGDVLREQRRSSEAQEGLQAQELQERSRSNRMREAQESDSQDLQAADKGLERQGQSRADKLRQEMEQGRLQAQMDKPLEVAGPDRATISQTPERVANDKSQRASAELNARARFQDSVRRLQTARATGNKEEAAEAGKNAEQYIESASRLLNNFQTSKMSDTDWDDVSRLATKFGEQHPDPALQAEITARTFGPRLKEFLRANVDQWSLRYIAGTGDMPDGKLVDLASPMMGALTQSADKVAAYLRQADATTGGAFSAGMKITSQADRNRIVRKMAAEQLLLFGQQAQQQGAGQPIPSQGGPSARPQPSGDAIPNPGGGPPLLRSRDDIQRSAERGRAAGAPAAAGSGESAYDRRKRAGDYGLGGGGKR